MAGEIYYTKPGTVVWSSILQLRKLQTPIAEISQKRWIRIDQTAPAHPKPNSHVFNDLA